MILTNLTPITYCFILSLFFRFPKIQVDLPHLFSYRINFFRLVNKSLLHQMISLDLRLLIEFEI